MYLSIDLFLPQRPPCNILHNVNIIVTHYYTHRLDCFSSWLCLILWFSWAIFSRIWPFTCSNLKNHTHTLAFNVFALINDAMFEGSMVITCKSNYWKACSAVTGYTHCSICCCVCSTLCCSILPNSFALAFFSDIRVSVDVTFTALDSSLLRLEHSSPSSFSFWPFSVLIFVRYYFLSRARYLSVVLLELSVKYLLWNWTSCYRLDFPPYLAHEQ